MDDAWSPWSEWAYDEKNKTMYRVRQDRYGNLDYQTSTSTPRETGGVAAITQTLGTTTLSSPSSSYENPHSSLPENYVVSSHKDKDRSSKPSKSKSKDKDKGKEKSTSKHHSHDKSSSHRKGHVGTSSAAAAPSGRGGSSTASSSKQHADLYDPSQLSIDPQTGQYFYHRRESVDSTGQDSEYPTTDEQQHELLNAAENAEASAYPFGQGIAGPSDPSYSASANTYELEDDGSSTPRNHNHIAADQEDDTFEQMDPRYRVEHSSRFEPGSIFKVYWSEPQGSSDNHKHPSVSGKQEIQDKFGMPFYVGFRRFIVIANDQGHCTCVPILTYGSRGCRKSGVKPNKHGIVHEVGRSARRVDGEPPLGFPPVQVQLTQDGEKLSKESRVNYSKLVTVEHNVAVFFIGSVVHASWPIVEDAVNQCWDQKVHHRRPRH